MESNPVFVGIDVSKARLDMAGRTVEGPLGAAHPLLSTAAQVSNTDAGLAQLISVLGALAPALIVLEATGGYERLAAATLAAAGLPVVVVNPRQVRDFAKAIGQLAKTD